jgi:hypothetical protein
MGLRNMVALTEAAYVRAVKNFSKHFGKSPDKLTRMCARYRLSLVGRGLGPQAVNQMMCALRFFYKTAMGIKDAHDHIPGTAVRSATGNSVARGVGRFLQTASRHQVRNGIRTIYAAGLRISDATLRVGIWDHLARNSALVPGLSAPAGIQRQVHEERLMGALRTGLARADVAIDADATENTFVVEIIGSRVA